MNVSLGLIIFSPYLAFLPLLYMLFHYIRQGQWELRDAWSRGLLLLFLWSLFVGLINESIESSLAAFVMLGFVAVSVYLQEHFQTVKSVEKLLARLFTLSIGSAVIGVLAKVNIITYTPAWWKYLLGTRSIVSLEEFERISGTFNNPNLAGTWYAIMLMIGFYFFGRTKGKRKLGYALGMVLFATVLVMTASRAAAIGIFIGFILYSYFAGHKKKMLFITFILLSSTALMLLFPDLFPRGEILYSSIRDRQEIWKSCFHMFLLKPFTGWGWFGIYHYKYSLYLYGRIFHAHNTLLTIATTLGLVGVGIFAWMFWDLLQKARFLFAKSCRLTPLLCGVVAMIAGQGIFDFTIMSPQIALLLVGSSAMIQGLAYSYQEAPRSVMVSSRVRHSKWKKA
ncbi:O-antigen ligase family protein [Ammoniphilus resinae]|uniref:O-antigen ligase n=1 Tax=Ammoniphilus resinae TaxID=861532 RepID=A0ABS4GV08_9BACL|nr:O-antigen ligase family protein [Ammoniphilus resinae]MBP1934089.1 O-antigen ligase [Ammoniphilus resinae]